MITHSVRSMYQLYVVCMGICMWYFAKLITLSTCIAVFPWDLDTMILEKSHTCDLNRHEVKGHLGVSDLWFKFLKKVTVSTYFDVFSWDLVTMILG